MSVVTTMRYGIVILPEHRWPQTRQLWRQAEEFGFDHGWTYDHLMWRWLRDSPWYASLPTLTAAATATSRIRLGTLVASPSFRHPVTFAKEIMTLDEVSGGRLICGMGAGAGGYDDEVLGERGPSPRQRAARFAEFVELTDRLLRDPVTSHVGEHYRCQDAHMSPGCVQRPRVPFAIAATGPRGMRLAARFADIWITAGAPGRFDSDRYDLVMPAIKDQLVALDEACADVGRDPTTLRRTVVTGSMVGGVTDSVESFQDAAGTFAGIGITDLVVHWPRPSFPYQGRVDVLADIAGTVLSRHAEPASDTGINGEETS